MYSRRPVKRLPNSSRRHENRLQTVYPMGNSYLSLFPTSELKGTGPFGTGFRGPRKSQSGNHFSPAFANFEFFFQQNSLGPFFFHFTTAPLAPSKLIFTPVLFCYL